MNQGDMKNQTGNSCNCMDMIQLVIDGEASQDQINFFRNHLQECSTCANNYSVDVTIQHLVKSTCCGGQAPQELIEKIRAQLNRLD